MQAYRIYFEDGEQADILRILSHYGDVFVDDVSHNAIDISLDREDADEFYGKLMDQLEREVYDLRTQYRFV